MKWIKIPSIVILVLTMSLSARTDLGNGFWVEDNNVTVTCDGASSTDSSTIEHNGKLFTKISSKTDVSEAYRSNGSVKAENACTTGIKDMYGWFYDKGEFNKDISHWNTTSVNSMSYIFAEATNISIENKCKIIDGWNKTESDANNLMYITGSSSGFSFAQCLSSKDFSITMDEDTSHTFTQNDFNFTDYLGGTFDSIYITSLPSNGDLDLAKRIIDDLR